MSKQNWYRVAVVFFGFVSSGFMQAHIIPLGAMAGGIMLGLAWAYVDLDPTDWESIAHGLANPENLPEWERATEAYEKAVGK